jgi:uncharacterized membrane protein
VTSWIWAIGRLLGLSTTAGVRGWMTLFVVSVMSHEGWLFNVPARWSWVESSPAMVVFGILMIFEIAVDKMPSLDRLQDRLGLGWRMAAGAIVGACAMGHGWLGTIIGLVAGAALAAFGLKVKRAWRPRSPASTTTLPLMSLLEDLGSLLSAFASAALPPAGYAVFGWMAWFWTRLRHRRIDKYRDLQAEAGDVDGTA